MSVEAWPEKTIGDLERDGLLELRTGFAQGVHNEGGRGVPHLRPFNVTDDGRIDFEKIKFIEPPPAGSPQWLRARDVVFNNTNSEALTGKTALFESDVRCVPSNHMTVLRGISEKSPDPYWLAAHLRYLWKTGVFRTLLRRYVGQATVSLTRLRDLEIPLPPLEEQRAIAHVLRTVQRAKEATEQVIHAAQELKSSLIEHLLMPDANGDGTDWPEVRLGDLAEILVGFTFKSADFSDDPSDTRLLRGANIGIGSLQWSDTKYWPRHRCEGFEKYLVEPGDVILGMDRPWISTGFRCAVATAADAPALLVQRVARLRGTDRLVTELIPHILNSIGFMRYLEPIMTGVSVPHISETQIASYAFRLPPTDVQSKVVSMLSGVERKIAAEEARRDALATLFDSLLHDLMTARLRATELIPEVA